MKLSAPLSVDMIAVQQNLVGKIDIASLCWIHRRSEIAKIPSHTTVSRLVQAKMVLARQV